MSNPTANFAPFESKCRSAGLTEAAIAAFRHNYEQLAAGATGLVPEDEIEAVSNLPYLNDMSEPEPSKVKPLLSRTAVLKLNGGLGTSMGLEKAKSLLVVKDKHSFLDLIALQIKHMRAAFDSKVRFILMNSFSTSEDTRAFLAQHHPDLLKEAHIELMQNKSPKVDAASLGPASYPSHPDNEWCPPGHGDIYPSLLGSGMLEQLLGEGVRYLFVSNSDNLGACLDLTLLSYFADSGKAFVMEVCERSAADKKGGHLCQRKADGSLILRESAQCPEADKAAFEDIDKHRFFNTNNLYVDLEQLKARLEECGGLLRLPLIKNKKTVNPRDSKSPPVFQLETAMGSAIECFNNTGAVVVPRSRFAPVKTCADLLVLRSDCYTIHENATVGAAVDKLPLVKLDDAHYKLVDQLEALVPPGEEPSLLQASALTVKGPVKFTKGVTVVGSVTFQAAPGSSSPASLAAGTYTDTTLTVGEPALVPA
ncbi:UDP-glucose pyrophosphorylase [Haematococcus lacustris]